MEKTSGLKSLDGRIKAIEKELNKEYIPENEDRDTLTEMLNELNKKELIKKKENNKVILEHYEKDLCGSIIYPTDDYFVDIVVFTIKYVESNSYRISTYLSVKCDSLFKKTLCTSFIMNKLTGFNNEMIENSINSLVKLLFPKHVNVSVDMDLPLVRHPSVKKRGFFNRK